MDHGNDEKRELLERLREHRRHLPVMLVQSQVRLPPCFGLLRVQQLAKVRAHQRMRIEGAGGVLHRGRQQSRGAQAGERDLPQILGQTRQPIGQTGDGRRCAQGGHGAFVGRPVEQAEQAQHRALSLTQPRIVRGHHSVCLVAADALGRLEHWQILAAANIAAARPLEVPAQQRQRERVAVHVLRGLVQLRVRAGHAELAQQHGPRGGGQPAEIHLRRGPVDAAGQLGHGHARGDDAEAEHVGGQLAQEDREIRVFEATFQPVPARWMLERLHAVEHEQRALPADQLGQSQAAVARRAGRGVGIAEPAQGGVDEGLGRRHRVAGSLAVE
jgi:hypothetical protein